MVDELTQALWKAITRYPKFEELNPHRYPGIARSVREVLKETTHAYNVCGTQARCTDGLEPSPWSPPNGHLAKAIERAQHKKVKPLQLELEKDLQDWLHRFDGRILVLFQSGTKEEGAPPNWLVPVVEKAIKETLGPYLFKHPGCMTGDLCRQRQSLDAWTVVS
jgi:hypothetical protein